MTIPTNTIRVALRFNRRDAPLLRDLAHRCRAHPGDRDLQRAAIIYRQAAEDAEVGEPYTIICSSVDEARRYQAEFVLQGCTPPTLEHLS